jgi:RNA polymerase sigma-70 factor (ECF subfamily)
MSANWQHILDGCLKRDRASQKKLYEAFFSYGMSVAIRYCVDRDQAVAVVHDAFLTVYRKLDKYDSEQPFKPWFRIIVVRAALDFLRKQRKHSVLVELEDHTPIHGREEILSRIGYQELLSMVLKLSEGYRTVFNLHVIDGFKHEEIAEKLGISVGTSKSNLFKARGHLKRMVEESLQITNSPTTVNA